MYLYCAKRNCNPRRVQERSKLIRAFLLTSFKFLIGNGGGDEYYDDGNISVVLREAIGVLPKL